MTRGTGEVRYWSHEHADDGKRHFHPADVVCLLDRANPVPTENLGPLFEDPSTKIWAEAITHNLTRQEDPVNRPSHYNQLPVECIDVAEHFGYLLGNTVKYIWRHQYKGKPLEDLKKARFYLDRRIKQLEENQ